MKAALLDRFTTVRVLVVGDVMLDEYLWGESSRISPEAPVPIVDVTRRTSAPGGAANAAANARSLGATVAVVGLVGEDAAAATLRDDLARRGIDADLLPDRSRPTTTKFRLMAQHQQVARYDLERREGPDAAMRRMLLDRIGARVAGCDACLLSDYGKGVLAPEVAREATQLLRSAGKPIVVDPKGSDFAKYAGATVVTPNIRETEAATGREIADEAALADAARRLYDVVGASLLVTRGARGVSLFVPGSTGLRRMDMPTLARTVFDVTGAGDTVAAALAVAIAAGASLEEAAMVANVAAGVACGKVGTAAVELSELRALLAD